MTKGSRSHWNLRMGEKKKGPTQYYHWPTSGESMETDGLKVMARIRIGLHSYRNFPLAMNI